MLTGVTRRSRAAKRSLANIVRHLPDGRVRLLPDLGEPQR